MVPTPVPAAPSGTHVDTDAGNRSTAVPGSFDAALQQTQPDRKTPAAPHDAASHDADSSDAATADAATGEGRAAKTRDSKAEDTKDTHDKHQPAANPANAPGAAVPTAALPPAPASRQVAAVRGKPLPTGAQPDTVPGAAVAAPAGAAATQPGRALATSLTHPAVPAASGASVARQAPTANTTAADGTDGTGVTHPTTTTPQPAMPIAQVIDAIIRKDGTGDTSRGGTGNTLGSFMQLAPVQNGAATGGQAPAQLTLQAAPGQPQFVQEITQHVAWLVGNQIQQARIQLNPRALGPIRVDITTHHDHVDVSFAVQHPQTIQALQQTLPQLHDLLAQQGLNLGQASVGQQAPGQQHQPPAARPGSAWRDADVTAPVHASAIGRTRVGGVDEFA